MPRICFGLHAFIFQCSAFQSGREHCQSNLGSLDEWRTCYTLLLPNKKAGCGLTNKRTLHFQHSIQNASEAWLTACGNCIWVSRHGYSSCSCPHPKPAASGCLMLHYQATWCQVQTRWSKMGMDSSCHYLPNSGNSNIVVVGNITDRPTWKKWTF